MPTTTWDGWTGAIAAPTLAGSVSGTWDGWTAQVSLGDQVSVSVYDAATGKQFLAPITSAKVTLRDVLSTPGTVTVAALLSDAAVASITDRCIIKVAWRGVTVGGRYNGEDCSLAVDGNQWLTMAAMPTLLGLLHDGPVYADGGLPASGVVDPDTPSTRTVGPMNPRGPWYVPADWSRPLGVTIAADTTKRNGYPRELAGVGALWIAPSPGPEADQAAGTVAHFRWEGYVAEDTPVEFIGTADNYLSFWADSQEVITPDYQAQYTWRQVYSWKGILKKGHRVVYGRVTNAARSVGANPLGFIGACWKLDATGNHAGLLFVTDTTHWWSSSANVGWYPGQALYQLVSESQAAADRGPSMLAMTFTPTHGSDGVPWSGTRQEFQFNTLTDTLDVAVAKFAQSSGDTTSGIDVTTDAAAMTLDARQRLGADRYSTVQLSLGDASPAGNLMQYDTSTPSTRFTVAVGQLSDGRWHTVQDAAGVAAVGRIVLAVQLGSTGSPEAAEILMLQMLAQSAQPVTSAVAKTSTLTGPQIHKNYFLGDSIKGIAARGAGLLKKRVFAWNLDTTGDVLQAWPELIEDSGSQAPRRGPLTPGERLRDNLRAMAPGSAFGQTPNARAVSATPTPSQSPQIVDVTHNGDGNFPRPAASKVMWSGSATPLNALDNDLWYPADL